MIRNTCAQPVRHPLEQFQCNCSGDFPLAELLDAGHSRTDEKIASSKIPYSCGAPHSY